MKNIFLFSVSFIFFISFVFSQNIADEDPDWRADSAGIHQKIDSIFMNLDKTKMSTGFLFERITMPFSKMQNYSGHSDSIIEVNQWHQMYFELKHFAEFTPTSLPSSHDILKQAENSNTSNIIPLGIINMNINRIKTIALDSGLLYIQGEQLYENLSSTQSPYEVKKVFAISPLNNDPLRSPVTFLIDTSFCFSNSPAPISHFEIDFGDGSGFRTVHFGEQIIVNYIGLDSVIILSKAFSSSDTLRSRSLAFIVNNSIIQSKSGGSGVHDCSDFKIPMHSPDVNDPTNDYFGPDAVKTVTVGYDFYAEIGQSPPYGWTPQQAGRAYIKYGCQNTTGKLIKPFIFVDGIDFGNISPANKGSDLDYGLRYGDRGWKQFLMGVTWDEDKKETDDLNIKGVVKLMKKLCSEGYDMVMLDPVDGATDIRYNAFALIDLIKQVNAELISNNSKNQIVVCGASMGGQQARYALRCMERKLDATGNLVWNHNTRLYISLDSPNRGANIALGTQYAMRFGSLYFWTDVVAGALFRPASKQLLLYHYIPSEVANKKAKPYQEHIDFYNDPNMITFPQKPKLVAITNGSGIGKSQGTDYVFYDPGDLTINIYTGRWFRARAVGDKNQSSQNEKGPEVTVFYGSYSNALTVVEVVSEWVSNWIGEWFNNVIGFVIKTVYVTTTDVVEMNNTLPYDNTSGGWRNTNEFFVTSLPSAGILNLHAEHGRYNHSFIPTYSAMGISLDNIPNSDISLPMSATSILNGATYPRYKSQYGSISPFDVIYAPQDNLEHITVNDENIGWIMNEVSPPDLFLQNKFIVSNAPLLGYSYAARNTMTISDFVVDGNGTTGATVDFSAGQSITVKSGTWFKKGSNVHLFIQPFQCDAVCRMANPNSTDGTGNDKNDIHKGGDYVAPTNVWSDNSIQEKKNTEPIRPTSIFPNPFNDHLHIDYSVQNEGAVNISVYNLIGQKVKELVSTSQHQAGNNTTTLDARKLSPGVYYIRIIIEDKSETIKVVKMK